MNAEHIREGGCLCGAIRYRVRGRESNVCHCHCTMCQKAAGAAFVTWIDVPTQSLEIVKGKPAVYKSSAIAERMFCADCGTALTFQFVRDRSRIDVTACSLDDPSGLAPTDHIWTSTALRWAHTDDGLPRYAESRRT
ncbi:MAG: GFA family protein [Rhodospirillales bacterium]|nr:GFA family protein [Rhodospirillales bacterium]